VWDWIPMIAMTGRGAGNELMIHYKVYSISEEVVTKLNLIQNYTSTENDLRQNYPKVKQLNHVKYITWIKL